MMSTNYKSLYPLHNTASRFVQTLRGRWCGSPNIAWRHKNCVAPQTLSGATNIAWHHKYCVTPQTLCGATNIAWRHRHAGCH